MFRIQSQSWLRTFPAVATGLLLLGCGQSGPATGLVSGAITLNGEPLPSAEVVFYPDSGRASSGATDENGQYELMFTYDTKGCLPGEHQVVVSTRVLSSDEPDAVRMPELVPRKYRKKGELTATVEPGKNVINFDLTK
ncbi:Ig-like domain-containing protein [Blastopirellula sp. J2-11]|uniref:Ig-like domain-containing protein n=1 Tax=Blastopirellula sp. J2-11 TaxID=2943192 RepID=UPI0021CA8053|nr:Ig-like domain-containing protein [Blastopirellula sp. J2-11]UUO09002.1 Ig-like domain-containing protein [Blastopirellula sp. J2-11]